MPDDANTVTRIEDERLAKQHLARVQKMFDELILGLVDDKRASLRVQLLESKLSPEKRVAVMRSVMAACEGSLEELGRPLPARVVGSRLDLSKL